jgi:hypothetical protein
LISHEGHHRFEELHALVAGPLDDAEFDHFALQKTQAPARVAFRAKRDQPRLPRVVEYLGVARGLRLNTATRPSSTSYLRVR